MKIKLFIVGIIFLSGVDIFAMSCKRYFHHVHVREVGVNKSFEPLIEGFSQDISELERIRLQIDIEADTLKSLMMVARYLSGSVLPEKMIHTSDEFADVIANTDFNVIRVQDLLYEHLLVEEAFRYQTEIEGSSFATRAEVSVGDREVRFVSPDRFFLNSLYKLYVNEVYSIIYSYLKLPMIPKDVKLDRIEFLLRADIRYVNLDRKEREQLIGEILFFGLQGTGPKLTADRFFLNRR